MQPRIEEVLAFLESQRSNLIAALAKVSPASARIRPEPERWSVAEIVAHIAVVEAQIASFLQHRFEAARANGIGRETQTSPVVPTVPVARVLDRSYRITASEASQPQTDIDLETALGNLAAKREVTRAVILSGDGLALEEIVGRNPALGDINAYQWLVFIGAHEARHTLQIGEVIAQMSDQERT